MIGPEVEGNTVLQNDGKHAAEDKGLQLGHESPHTRSLAAQSTNSEAEAPSQPAATDTSVPSARSPKDNVSSHTVTV